MEGKMIITRINRKIVGYGFLSWMIPFVVSLPFFARNGQPRFPVDLIKSLMILVGAASGGVLLFRLFKDVRPSLSNGIAVGSLWVLMNIALDVAILIPMARMGAAEYFTGIGLRYLQIPIMAGAMGAVSAAKREA
jgi:hypothetical protein